MANESFRGTRVLIDKLSIAPGPGGVPVMTCAIQFTSDEGVVHAVAQHQFVLEQAVGPQDELTAAARELMQRLIKRVEGLHFVRPDGHEQDVLRGIAETLAGTSPRTSDEPGTQG